MDTCVLNVSIASVPWYNRLSIVPEISINVCIATLPVLFDERQSRLSVRHLQKIRIFVYPEKRERLAGNGKELFVTVRGFV